MANVSLLIDRLEHGEDFRVRVQAALELGKTKNSTVRAPLEKALDDENAAVRAAAAAALKALGDKRAIPALERHKKDSSPAVRSQVQHSIAALRAVVHAEKTRVLVKLGKMKDAKGVRTGKLLGEMEQTSRQKFDELPGVKVVDGTPDEKIPLVMVTGSVRKPDLARGLGRRVLRQRRVHRASDARAGHRGHRFRLRQHQGQPGRGPGQAAVFRAETHGVGRRGGERRQARPGSAVRRRQVTRRL